MDYKDLALRFSKGERHNFIVSALENGKIVASNSFELRFDELRIIECLRELEKTAVMLEPQASCHMDFGQELHKKVLAGELWSYLQKQLETNGEGLRISLQFDDNASELASLPWEFLHDGEDFLVARRNLLISRMPSTLERVEVPPLESVLRMLVVISTPNDPHYDLLDMNKERETILTAVDKLYVEHKMEVDFTDDATFDTIQSYLNERDYHIVHFIGHGKQSDGQGYLVLESEDGRAREVKNQAVSDLFSGHGIRLVVLNACQSADLASKLVRKKIPAVVAMQYNIMDDSAVKFASIFYRALASGKAVDLSLTEARIAMRNAEGGNNVDFVTPVLHLLDPLCLKQGTIKIDDGVRPSKLMMLKDLQVMKRGFVGRRKELLILQNAFITDVKRAAIIYGFGGVGKTVLATHLALKMLNHFEGVFGFKCSTNTRPEEIIDELNEFLKMGNILDLDRVLENQSLRGKTVSLVEILIQHSFLLIFDSFESCLDERWEKISNPELREFVEALLNSTFTGTKYIFTTRCNFDPLGGLLVGDIEHLSVSDLPFHQAIWLMNNHSELAELDIKKKKDIYKSIGGHPWMIGMFALHASIDTVDSLMLELEDPLKRHLKEFTLFDKSYSMLDDATKELLFRVSVFEEAVSVEALSWMMGNDVCASPPIRGQLDALLNWGLVVKKKESKRDIYSMGTLVRDFVREEGKRIGLDEKTILLRAAGYYENRFAETRTVRDLLKAWNYYYGGKNYKRAFDIAMGATGSLLIRGYTELALKLVKKSKSFTKGMRKAKAEINLSMIYLTLGDVETANKYLCEGMETLAKKNPKDIAPGIFAQAVFYQQKGLYKLSIGLYKKCQKIFKDLGDELGLSATLQQLGMIEQIQGNYEEAVELYHRGLKILKNLDIKEKDELKVGKELGRAGILQQLGIIKYDQGSYKEAVGFYNESLEVFRDHKHKLGIGTTLHLLGEIDYDQGNYKEAIERYLQSLDIFHELPYPLGEGTAIRSLGEIDRDQGNFDEAVKRFQKSLKIFRELENQLGVGTSLYSLGSIKHDQGLYNEAIDYYKQSQQIFEDLGNKMGKAKTIYALGAIRHEWKDYEGAIKLCEEA